MPVRSWRNSGYRLANSNHAILHAGVKVRFGQYLVLAPLKVASRTILFDPSGSAFFWRKDTISAAICHRLRFGCDKIVFLTRCPYRRLESVFKDKFRNNPSYRLSSCDFDFGLEPLQGIQRQFISSCNPSLLNEPLQCSYEYLLAVSFDAFLAWLDLENLQRDPHLLPQTETLRVRWRFFDFYLSPDIVIDIDNPLDMHRLSSIASIDTRVSCARNSTRHLDEKLGADQTLLKKVSLLYASDLDFRARLGLCGSSG